MDSRVVSFYDKRPDSISNSADIEPVDPEIARNIKDYERRIGAACTEEEVSVTIVDDE